MPESLVVNPIVVQVEDPEAGSLQVENSSADGAESLVAAESSATWLPSELPKDVQALHAFMQRSMAVRTEAPLNLHQATAYFCLQKHDCPLVLKLAAILGSFFLVFVQIWVCLACIIGINVMRGQGDVKCLNNGDCQQGAGNHFTYRFTFCDIAPDHPRTEIWAAGTDWAEHMGECKACGSRGSYHTLANYSVVYTGDNGHPGEPIVEDLDWDCDPTKCAGKQCSGDCIPQACFDAGLCDTILAGMHGDHRVQCKPEAVDECVLTAKSLETYNCVGCTNYSFVNHESFQCPNGDHLCRACYDPAVNHFFTVEDSRLPSWGQHLMGGNEYATYLLAAAVVATSTVSEIRDIKLCSITVENCSGASSKPWLIAIELLQGVRQFGFLSFLLWLVSSMVEMQGSDSLSICFNTVAVLFLLAVRGSRCCLSMTTRSLLKRFAAALMPTP
eukprot:COSAG02_NODE_2899_length_7779_cov_6.028776_8_plen_444_part_00